MRPQRRGEGTAAAVPFHGPLPSWEFDQVESITPWHWNDAWDFCRWIVGHEGSPKTKRLCQETVRFHVVDSAAEVALLFLREWCEQSRVDADHCTNIDVHDRHGGGRIHHLRFQSTAHGWTRVIEEEPS